MVLIPNARRMGLTPVGVFDVVRTHVTHGDPAAFTVVGCGCGARGGGTPTVRTNTVLSVNEGCRHAGSVPHCRVFGLDLPDQPGLNASPLSGIPGGPMRG